MNVESGVVESAVSVEDECRAECDALLIGCFITIHTQFCLKVMLARVTDTLRTRSVIA